MKQFLRIIIALSIIAFAAMGTAVSCGTAGGGDNNNSGGGDGGGDGNGGGGNTNTNGGGGGTDPTLTFTMEDDKNLARQTTAGDEILINADQFPTAAAGALDARFGAAITAIDADVANKTKKIFTVTLSKSSEGFLLVGGGDTAVNAFSTSGGPKATWGAGTAADDKGIHLVTPQTGAGLKIYSVFAEKTPGANVYAFTPTTNPNGTQPIFYCVADASEFTSAATAKFKGGQTANCYISSVGTAFGGTTATARTKWLDTEHSATFKKSFQVTFAGINTDNKDISAIGLPGTDGAAKLVAFNDGIDATEMAAIVAANKTDRKVVTLKILRGTEFAAAVRTSQKLTFDGIDDNAVKIVDNEIRIKASAFPETAAADAAANFNTVVGAATATGTRKKIFTVKLDGSTGGFLLAEGGVLPSADKISEKFSLPPLNADWTGTATDNKGVQIVPPRDAVSGLSKAGLNIYSVFADKAPPTDNVYAFTRTTDTTTGTQPIFYCVAVAPKFTAAADRTSTAVTFEGGQNADCYVSSVGAAFGGAGNLTARNAWLTAAEAPANFKRSFNVTFAGIGTDTKAVSGIGLTGTTAQNVTALENGLDATEMARVIAANKSGYTNMTLKIVNDKDFASGGNDGGVDGGGNPDPGDGTLRLDFTMVNPTGLAKTNDDGTEIIIKAGAFPTTVAGPASKNFDVAVANAATSRRKIFDVSINGSTGGLLLVGNGNLTAVNQFSIPEDFTTPWTTEYAKYNKGIHALRQGTAALKIYSVFADKTTPIEGNAGEIFAFSASATTQPIFYCVAVASEVVNFTTPTATLKDGQKAQCYISSFGSAALGDGTAWLAGSGFFKKSFQVSFAGISTGDRPISEIGLDGATATDRVNAFKDNITTSEMGKIAAANRFAVKTMTIKIIDNTTFGGNGNGGGGTEQTLGKLKFTMTDASDLAKINDAGTEIRIKASAFPTTPAATAAQHFGTVAKAAEATRRKVFSVSLDGTTGGFLLAKGGDVALNQFSIPEWISYRWRGTSAEDIGIHSYWADASDSNPGLSKQGMTVYSVFADKTTPTASAPFSFTATSDTQPIFYCVAVAPKLTNVHTSAATTMEGGQSADCYISSVGSAALSKVEAKNKWLTAATDHFKKSFQLTFAGIGTGNKAISAADFGMDGAGNIQRAQDFEDGIDTGDMGRILAANPGNSDRRVMTIKIVNNADFDSGRDDGGGDGDGAPPPPEFTATSVNDDLAKVVETGGEITIQLKASAFPAGGVRYSTTYNPGRHFSTTLGNMVPAFKMTMTPATGGLVLAGRGSFESFDVFTTKGSCKGSSQGGAEDADICAYTADPGFIPAVQGTYGNLIMLEAGLNVFGTFMDKSAPGNTDPNSAPFAFTATTGDNATQPIIICRTLMPINVPDMNGSQYAPENVLRHETVFTGGHEATCFVGSMGAGLGTPAAAAKWLTATGNFKRSFNIAFAGIKTEDKPFNQMGWLVNDGSIFKDFSSLRHGGIEATTIRSLKDNNPTTYKKIKVEIVRDAVFTGNDPSPQLLIGPHADAVHNGTPYVKVRDNNKVYIDANGLAADTVPIRPGQSKVPFSALTTVESFRNLVKLAFDDNEAGLFIVTRADTTKDNITLRAAGSTIPVYRCFNSEAAINTAVAARNAICRSLNNPLDTATYVNSWSHLGTTFNNTDTANFARGAMVFNSSVGPGANIVLSDTSPITKTTAGDLSLYYFNDGAEGTALARKEIDNAWVASTTATKTVTLNAIGIKTQGKTFSQLSTDGGFNLARFNQAMNNTEFKKLLRDGEYDELTFTVEILNSTDFAAK